MVKGLQELDLGVVVAKECVSEMVRLPLRAKRVVRVEVRAEVEARGRAKGEDQDRGEACAGWLALRLSQHLKPPKLAKRVMLTLF